MRPTRNSGCRGWTGDRENETLAARIAYLLKEQGIKPDEITAVTFTNQAAAEMRRRLEIPLGKRVVNRMTIGTFHGLCLGLLKTSGLSVRRSFGHRVGNTRVPQKENGREILPASRIPCEKWSLIPICRYRRIALYRLLFRLQELGVLDFDDLLTEALRIDIRGHRAFSHLLVDEFQDINDTQYDLIRTWSREGNSLFVIGDPGSVHLWLPRGKQPMLSAAGRRLSGMQEID